MHIKAQQEGSKKQCKAGNKSAPKHQGRPELINRPHLQDRDKFVNAIAGKTVK